MLQEYTDSISRRTKRKWTGQKKNVMAKVTTAAQHKTGENQTDAGNKANK